MRLFDKCLSQRKDVAEPLRQIADKVVVVACEPIVNYFLESVNDKEWSSSLAPYARLPWSHAFFEWGMSRELTQGQQTRVDQIGFILTESSPTNIGLPDLEKQAPQSVVLVGVPVISVAGTAYLPTIAFHAWMENSGKILSTFASDDPGAKYGQDAFATIVSMFRICLVANTFLNCCNVKLQDVTDDLQPEPKVRRRLKIPDVKRYTLNICGHFTKPSRNANEPQQGVMPFHLCRGHFATYTADKPMFGNPKLVGRYWHPPHMRGKKENGVIEKDYAIVGE